MLYFKIKLKKLRGVWVKVKKKLLSIFLILTTLLVFIPGCGKKDDTADKKEEQKTESKEEKKDTGEVTVYSPHNAEIINPIVKEFQERTGIKVNVVAAGTGELLKRVEAEKDNPLGDVMWGGGAESLDSYTKYFEPYKSTEDSAINPIFKDKNNCWTGFSALPMVIMYNKKLVKPEEVPKSWKDLTDPKWKGKIAYADPARSGSSYTTLVTMLTAYKDDGEDGWKFIRSLVKNLDGKIISGSSGVYKGVADGEYALGLTLEEAAMRYVVAGAEVGMVYPAEGTSAVPDGIAIIKNSKNMDNAKKFLDFVVGKDVQGKLVGDFCRRSVRTDIDAPTNIEAMDKIKLVDYDFSWAAANKDKVLEKWKDVVMGK